MSHESNDTDPAKIFYQPAMSQLSVDAACFVPTNFEQSVASTSDEVPAYFNSYVWPGAGIKDASPYLSGLGQWPLSHPYGNPGLQSPFHYSQYPPPPPPEYWPVTLGNENLTSRIISPSSRTQFNSPYAEFSWNSSPSLAQNVQPSLPVRQSKSNRTKDPNRSYPVPINSTIVSNSNNQSDAPSAVSAESREPVRSKKKKKKSRSIIRIEPTSEVNLDVGAFANKESGTDALSRNNEREKSVEEEDVHGNAGRIPDDGPVHKEGSKVYRDSGAQTDFSDELSRLTLSEKPSFLYDRSSSSPVLSNGFFSFPENSATTTQNSPGPVPLLWTTIVSQKAVHPAGKIANSENNAAVDPNFKFKCNQSTRPGIGSVNKKYEKKFGFDHSSTRSQSGKRKSTGISTNDQKQDQSTFGKVKHEYSSGKHEYSSGKHEYSSGKHEYSAGKHEYSSGKHEYLADKHEYSAGRQMFSSEETSSITSRGNLNGANTKRDISGDGKRMSSANENNGKSQRVLKNADNDFPSSNTRPQRQMPREKTDFSSSVKREGPAKHEEERNHLNGPSRSPSWKRSKAISSSSTSNTTKLSRSISSGRVTSTGVAFSIKNKTGDEKGKLEATNSVKKIAPTHNGSKYGETTSAVIPEIKVEGTAKRRRKNRKKKPGAKEDGEKDTAAEKEASSFSVGPNVVMQFDDDDEFPGLAAQASPSEISSGPIKYSDILSGRAKTPSRIYASNQVKRTTKDLSVGEDDSDWDLDESASKQTESQRKTTPQQTTSARSISQPPKSSSKPVQEKRSVGAGAKTKEPITLSLFEMITVKSKNKKTPEKEEDKKSLKAGTKSDKKSKSGNNVLDSSGVQTRRGKEREVPKPKKPSLLRKVILKERESRRQKFLRDCKGYSGEEETATTTEDLCGDGLRRHASAPSCTSGPRVASLSPIPTKDVSSPQDEVPASEAEDSHKVMLQSMIHSRRFREYCTQVLSKEIDDGCLLLLQELVRFQDRLYHKDPNKARLKRRIVLGLREVTKHLKARRIKCVIISPNLERIQSKGGLDEALHSIIEMCQGQNIPFIFALSRKQLGKACCKIVPVSVVGIFSYEGAEEYYKKLRDLTEKARESYKEMVSNLATEVEELRKLYPEDTWPLNENICGKETSENASASSSHTDSANVVEETCKETCLLSGCKTLGDAPSGDLARQLMQSKEDSYTDPRSPHEGHTTDVSITETGSMPSLEVGQEKEDGEQTLEISTEVPDALCPSDVEFILVNTSTS